MPTQIPPAPTVKMVRWIGFGIFPGGPEQRDPSPLVLLMGPPGDPLIKSSHMQTYMCVLCVAWLGFGLGIGLKSGFLGLFNPNLGGRIGLIIQHGAYLFMELLFFIYSARLLQLSRLEGGTNHGIRMLHLPLVTQIPFASNEDYWGAWGSILLDLLSFRSFEKRL